MRFFLLSFIIFCSFSTFAKTGYVDLMSAFENTRQGQRIKSRLKKSTEAAKKQIKSQELKIQKDEQAFKKEAPLLSEQARAKKIQQLQQKILNFQRNAKSKDLELQKLQNSLVNPVLVNLKKVIGNMAKKESYLVIENIGTDVLWVSSELNLTNKVSKEFNRRYK